MEMYLRVIAILIISTLFSRIAISQISDNSKIQYIQGSVLSSESDIIKLLDDSRWNSFSADFALPGSKIVIIIYDDKNNGIAYCNSMEFPVRYLSGTPIMSNGKYSKVVRALENGASLQLSDGSFWKVEDYDQYNTSYWLPPYPVIVASNELYMFNVKKGKKFWVTRAKD